MSFSIIAALAKNNVIGKDNKLPWNIPEDLAHFYSVVNGKPVVMGRRTYEAMGGPIKNSENIVLSCDQSLKIPGCVVLHSIDEVLDRYKNSSQEIMVIGGVPIYEKFLPLVDKMYLTFVNHYVDGDLYFPKWKDDDWVVTSKQDFKSDLYFYSFVILKRVRSLQTTKV
ncbi:MAG: dihydrofolate reductase [Gammaproteobacteria bacterium]|nr:dihydrofolate reductase [Gammaproteobacteria bacterium]